MRPLNKDESWKLFTSVFTPPYPAEERTVMLGEMVKSCEGVPQLIKELAFYLGPKQAEEWEIEYKNIQEHMYPRSFVRFIFSEDQQIDTEKLFHFWMIEGFLSTRRVRGERMMEELAHINIVKLQEEQVPTKKKFKAYNIVRGIENLRVSWGEQNLFLKIVDLRKNNCSLSSEILPPRLVIYLGNHGLAVAHEVVENVRSLRVVGGNKKQQEEERICPIEVLNLKYFRVLRILDFDEIDFQGQQLPGVYLICCRRATEDEETKTFISSIEVSDSERRRKLRLDSLKELETLENFNTSVCKVNDVYEFPKLRYLAANVEENYEDFMSITSYMQTTSNNCLCAAINIIDMNCYAVEMHSVLQEFLRCKVLQTLHFKGHIGHLPPYDEISQNFTQFLNNSHLKKDPMPTLEKLLNLGVLVLSDDAYMGKKMVCSASGFPLLKHLGFMNLHLLEKFEVECTAMPIVSFLKITKCKTYDLVIPNCLIDRCSNRQLKISLS
ncbi:probable disease resistance protein RF45 [Lycium ferocissimum]|uniref:probable disease resistance protein RF45 n=1 Tax=Lycium ferocissimum TaxID=112874 RepID=UPI0028149D0E|nr:probable disease resistance protein RF45 [Lycium ferocissimum]